MLGLNQQKLQKKWQFKHSGSGNLMCMAPTWPPRTQKNENLKNWKKHCSICCFFFADHFCWSFLLIIFICVLCDSTTHFVGPSDCWSISPSVCLSVCHTFFLFLRSLASLLRPSDQMTSYTAPAQHKCCLRGNAVLWAWSPFFKQFWWTILGIRLSFVHFYESSVKLQS